MEAPSRVLWRANQDNTQVAHSNRPNTPDAWYRHGLRPCSPGPRGRLTWVRPGPGRHSAGLCRDDGARGGRTNRQAVRRGQPASCHKGGVLFEIDPADYQIALEQAEARAHALLVPTLRLCPREREPKSQPRESRLGLDGHPPSKRPAHWHQSEGIVALDKAAIAKAQLDLRRTVIRSPVNGYVDQLCCATWRPPPRSVNG